MSEKSIIKSHLDLLEKKLSKVPDNTPNKGIWEASLFIWTSITAVIEEMQETIMGNGKDGILKRLANLEKKQDEIHGMVTKMALEKDTAPLTRNTLKLYIINKILPPLIVAFIMTIVGIFVLLAVSHWTELNLSKLL